MELLFDSLVIIALIVVLIAFAVGGVVLARRAPTKPRSRWLR